MVSSFPFANGLIEVSFDVFRGASKALLNFVPLVFLIRLIITKATLGGAREYGGLLKDLLFLYVGFYCFQEVMEMIMKAPEIAEHMLKNPEPISILNKDRGWIEWLADIWANDIVNIISSFTYWMVCFCYLIMMAIMIMLGAHMILFSTLFKMRLVFTIYMSLVLVLSAWPFVWYSVDQGLVFVIKGLKDSNNNNGVIIAATIGGVFKIFSPALGFFSAMKAPVSALKNYVMDLKDGARPVVGAGKKGVEVTKSAGQAVGMDRAVESFRSDPIEREEQRLEQSRQRRFSLSDAAPFLSYQAQRGLSSMRKTNRDERSKVNSFKEFDEKHKRKLHQRNVLKVEQKLSGNKVVDINQKQRLIKSQESSLQSLSKMKTEKSQQEARKFTKRVQHQSEVIDQFSKRSAVNDVRFTNSLADKTEKKTQKKIERPRARDLEK